MLQACDRENSIRISSKTGLNFFVVDLVGVECVAGGQGRMLTPTTEKTVLCLGTRWHRG